MYEFLMSLLGQAGTFGSIVAAVASVYSLKKCLGFEKSVEEMKSNDLAIIRAKLRDSANRAIEEGYICEGDLETCEALYTRYSSMGGNGFISKKMEAIRQLPSEKKK